MTDETLKRANDLKQRICRLSSFISTIKSNRALRIINKSLEKAKKITLCSSDYMRPYEYYEVSRETKEKIIQILEDEKVGLQKELDNL